MQTNSISVQLTDFQAKDNILQHSEMLNNSAKLPDVTGISDI